MPDAAAAGLLPALLAFQTEVETLRRDSTNPHFKSKYLSLEALTEQALPLLNAQGLVWTCRPGGTPDEPTLRYSLAHADSGEREDGEMPLLLSKRDPQGQGSAITYGRRYAFCAVTGVVADEDDDGNAASSPRSSGRSTSSRRTSAKGPAKATAEQLSEIKSLIRDGKPDEAAVRLALVSVGVDHDGRVSDAIKGLTKVQAQALTERLSLNDAHQED